METTLNELVVKYKPKKFTFPKVSCSNDAYGIARKVYELSNCELELKEYFFLLLLNRANEVLGYHKLSEGGISGTVADIRIAFASALKSMSSAMILIHNHPSGNSRPSQSDISLTKRFKEAGELLDIQVLDHLILTPESYYSLTDNGRI